MGVTQGRGFCAPLDSDKLMDIGNTAQALPKPKGSKAKQSVLRRAATIYKLIASYCGFVAYASYIPRINSNRPIRNWFSDNS